MKHLSIRWAVDRLLRGESTWPWSPPSLRLHLAGCEACRGYYDQGVLLLRAARGQPGAPGFGELERMIRRAEQASVAPLPVRPGSRRLLWALGLATLGVAAAGVWVQLRPAPQVGVVISAQRLVIDGTDAKPGTAFAEQQSLVASGGNAVVRLTGGRVVLIKEGSRLRFDASGAHAILESGGGYFRIQKGVGRFEVTAGDATVVVKGTEFLVDRKDLTTTEVVVDEGVVEVRGRTGSVQLGAGQQTTVNGTSPLVVTTLDLLERIRRGFQRLASEIDRALRN